MKLAVAPSAAAIIAGARVVRCGCAARFPVATPLIFSADFRTVSAEGGTTFQLITLPQFLFLIYKNKSSI
jgi:hypothetical protein